MKAVKNLGKFTYRHMGVNVNIVGNDQDSRYNQFWKDISQAVVMFM